MSVTPNLKATPRKQITLLDIYRARGFKLTRDQARRLVYLLKLTEERPATTKESP
ncbi:hypothetical protein [Streptomyces sp. MBT55]|uniref:hypothetical protein n=1 Tax=Streptomyces sp. MBT55 TaxID=1488386 RepID=UPI001912B648|nr:hypothetical protein [Streptomyces sp. MBT55]MBK6040831.1 hypothetical protein [Streptomyces sp. MBT55]